MSRGLTDKRYWRPDALGVWHCFKRLAHDQQTATQRFISLCHRAFLPRSGGGQGCRPPVGLRCGRCDGLEMDRVQAEESLPENPNWRQAIVTPR